MSIKDDPNYENEKTIRPDDQLTGKYVETENGSIITVGQIDRTGCYLINIEKKNKVNQTLYMEPNTFIALLALIEPYVPKRLPTLDELESLVIDNSEGVLSSDGKVGEKIALAIKLRIGV